jgi:hypothetical protein
MSNQFEPKATASPHRDGGYDRLRTSLDDESLSIARLSSSSQTSDISVHEHRSAQGKAQQRSIK